MMRFYSLLLIFTLTSCEQARTPTVETPESIILTYFLSTQVATEDNELNSVLSEFFGSGLTATPDSSVALWTQPESLCDYSENFFLEIQPKRYLPLGELELSRGTESVRIPAHSSDYSWGFSGRLSPGIYGLMPDGANGTARFQQSFEVLPSTDGIEVFSGNLANPAFPLPSPRIPASDDPHFELQFSRSQPLMLRAEAPENTDYLRLRLRDGSNRNMGDLTCYAKADETISISPSLLGSFRTGSDGLLQVDFISVSHLQNTARVQDSVVVSVTRQLHGSLEFLNNNQQLQKLELGRLTITE